MKAAGEHHVLDIVAGAVVEFTHVEGSRLKMKEIGFGLQALQDTLLHEMYVPDFIPGKIDRQTERSKKYFTHFKCTFYAP